MNAQKTAETLTVQTKGGTVGGDEAAVGCHLLVLLQIANVSLTAQEIQKTVVGQNLPEKRLEE